ncbi:hypothetical protein VTN31DRAFT_6634 [Thermomyces dupontii]|uniref:uncharacterized protein n=1 Tax=Talaromyces thermophilus TaxID=28565 RepID=UPI003744159D
MSFLAGFLGGFTLTSSVLVVSLQVHRSLRQQQRHAICEQTQILSDLASPLGAYYRRFATENQPQARDNVVPEKRPSAEDLLKHQWNEEVKKLARRALTLRWEEVQHTAVQGFGAIARLVKGE